MAQDENQLKLTTEKKNQIFAILTVGCDRETAANYVGCTTADIHRAMDEDASFAAEVRRTEASSEFNIMRVVHKAAEDVKNWRAGVWWLEMRAPDRFKSRSSAELTLRQVQEFANVMARIVCDEVRSEEEKGRVIDRMAGAVCELDRQVRATQLELGWAQRNERMAFVSVFDEGEEGDDGESLLKS
jgi:hypothetical protein